MGGVMPGDDGFGDTRGWDRASIASRSRAPYHPSVGQSDLLLPNEAGVLKTLALCVGTAICISILYLSIPLFLLNIFVPLGSWFGAIAVGSVPALTIILFVFSRHETRQLRRLAQEL